MCVCVCVCGVVCVGGEEESSAAFVTGALRIKNTLIWSLNLAATFPHDSD